MTITRSQGMGVRIGVRMSARVFSLCVDCARMVSRKEQNNVMMGTPSLETAVSNACLKMDISVE